MRVSNGADTKVRPWWRRRAKAWWKWLQPEIGTLLLLCLVLIGIWTFAAMADAVSEGDTASFDEKVLLAFRNPDNPAEPLGPLWLQEMARDVTSLGGVFIQVMALVLVIVHLLLRGKTHAALFVLVAVVGGVLLSNGLKVWFDRPRPDIVPLGMAAHSASFPSGHSMMAAVTYLTLASLLARFEIKHGEKIFVLLVATLMMVLVGASRVYLGVHWPTDVLGGWAAGASWATLCWLVALRLQRGGQIEPNEEDMEEAPAVVEEEMEAADQEAGGSPER